MMVTYPVIILALLVSGVVSGFITFRIHGMRLALHFVVLILALVATIITIITGNYYMLYGAVFLQIMTTMTAFTQTWTTLKYNFQTAPSYAPHLTLMTMIPVLAVASLI